MPLAIEDFRRFDALKCEVIYCDWYNTKSKNQIKKKGRDISDIPRPKMKKKSIYLTRIPAS